jgi:quaternary ammonium compound-resistance protein SugE
MTACTAWIVITIAGLFEVVWAVGLKVSDGFSRPVPAIVYACMILSVGFLGVAMRAFPISTAYAVWTGIGTLGTAAWGIIFLRESGHPARVTFIAVIFVGIVGLGIADRLIEGASTLRAER